MEKIKLKNKAQARALEPMRETNELYTVEGYAAKFAPYVLWEDEDGPIYEQFDRGCFDGADMSDVILQYDHAGRVYARTGNGTLEVTVDDIGLRIKANLGTTESARQLHEEIKAGLINKMSWRFTCGEYDFDPKTRTITHHTVKKVWDVSAVSIPANQDTEINARGWLDGVIEQAARREAELDERKRKLRITIQLLED